MGIQIPPEEEKSVKQIPKEQNDAVNCCDEEKKKKERKLSSCSHATEISLNQVQSQPQTSAYAFKLKLLEEWAGTQGLFDVLHAKQPF